MLLFAADDAVYVAACRHARLMLRHAYADAAMRVIYAAYAPYAFTRQARYAILQRDADKALMSMRCAQISMRSGLLLATSLSRFVAVVSSITPLYCLMPPLR